MLLEDDRCTVDRKTTQGLKSFERKISFHKWKYIRVREDFEVRRGAGYTPHGLGDVECELSGLQQRGRELLRVGERRVVRHEARRWNTGTTSSLIDIIKTSACSEIVQISHSQTVVRGPLVVCEAQCWESSLSTQISSKFSSHILKWTNSVHSSYFKISNKVHSSKNELSS